MSRDAEAGAPRSTRKGAPKPGAPEKHRAAKPGKPSRAKAGGRAAPMTTRQLRVAEEIRHVLAGIVARNEFRDPELASAQITVTEVRVSPDLKNATAFVARLGRTDIDALLPALRRARAYLRSELAQVLTLRQVPDLSFQADTALEYAMHIDTLLHSPDVARDLQAGKDADS